MPNPRDYPDFQGGEYSPRDFHRNDWVSQTDQRDAAGRERDTGRDHGQYENRSRYGHPAQGLGQRGYGPNDGPHGGKGPKGAVRSDARIKEDVHDQLTDHVHVDASQIEVDVKDGEVTLTGTVDDRNQKRMAEDAVYQLRGVKDVHNQLRLLTQPVPGPTPRGKA